MKRTFEHYAIEQELTAGLTFEDLAEIRACANSIKRSRPFRFAVHWIGGNGSKSPDFVTRGMEGYRSLPQGWLTLAMFSILPVAIISLKYSPNHYAGVALVVAYGLAVSSYMILRTLVETRSGAWQPVENNNP